MINKIIAVLLAAVIALSCCALPVSATISNVGMPNIEDYPKDEDGYNAYLSDMLLWGSVNTSAVLANPFLLATEEVCDFFGIDASASTDLLPQDIVGNAFSKYYKDPNYKRNYNNVVSYNGDLQLRIQSFTESPLKLDASNCNKSYYYGTYCYFRFELYFKNEIVETWYHCYSHANYKMTFNDWEWTYNNEGYVDGFRYIYYCKAINGTDPIISGYSFDLNDYVAGGDNVDFTIEVPYDQLYKDTPKVYITDNDKNSIQEFYYIYEGDKPTFVDVNNYNNKYIMNDNGQITYNNDDYYVYPIPDTYKDDELAQLKNSLALALLMSAMALKNGRATDLSSVNAYLAFISSQLSTMNTTETDSKKLLENILTALNNFATKNNTSLNNVNTFLSKLSENMTKLTEAICGDNDSKMDTVYEILLQIEENTSSIGGSEEKTEEKEEEEIPELEFEIQNLTKMIYDKIGFSQYFKTLNNLLGIFMGDDYSNNVNYDDYFDVSKYLNSGTDTKTAVASLTTEEYTEIYGEDIAEENLNISESAYLSQTAAMYNSSISAALTMKPSITFEFMGETYDLFGEWCTGEVYDCIRVLKEFIRIILCISWYFWAIKQLSGIISNAEVVDNYLKQG